MKVSYPYTLEQDDESYFVQFVDIDEAFTQGDTEESAAFNAAEVLTAVLVYRLEQGQDIPEPSTIQSGYQLATPGVEVQSALCCLWNKPLPSQTGKGFCFSGC